jgi:hypothetical protein
MFETDRGLFDGEGNDEGQGQLICRSMNKACPKEEAVGQNPSQPFGVSVPFRDKRL